MLYNHDKSEMLNYTWANRGLYFFAVFEYDGDADMYLDTGAEIALTRPEVMEYEGGEMLLEDLEKGLE